VQSYLQRTSIIPPAAFFNRNGRAYPDITAYGVNYLICAYMVVHGVHSSERIDC